MDLDEKQQTAAKQYLLGSLPTDLQEEMERNLMIEDGALEGLEAAEDDLIDEYISGELTEDQKAQFEDYFLVTPERRESLRFAELLRSHVEPIQQDAPEPLIAPSLLQRLWASPAASRTTVVFAILLVLVGGFWVFKSDIYSPKSFATLTLTLSSATRDSGEQVRRTQLASGVDALRLVLELPQDVASSSNYRVELVNEHRIQKAVPIENKNNQTLTVEIPAADLQPGQYLLNLFTVQSDGSEQRVSGSYRFAVD